MIIECCAQEISYKNYYCLILRRFSLSCSEIQDLVERDFEKVYLNVHRMSITKILNIANLFGDLLSSQGIGFDVFTCVHLTKDATTSSQRIFLKGVFECIVQNIGLIKLREKIVSSSCSFAFSGVFPRHSRESLRYSMNFFLTLGLEGLVEKGRTIF